MALLSLLLRVVLTAGFAYGFIVLFEHGTSGFAQGLATEWKALITREPEPELPPAPAPATPAPEPVAPAPPAASAPAVPAPDQISAPGTHWDALQKEPSDWEKLQSGTKPPL